MSTFDQSVLLARARISALRALVRAGGKPAAGQLLRAVEPLVGDLLPIPRAPAASEVEREFWAVLAGRWQAIDAAISVAAATPAGAPHGGTVVSRQRTAR
jgi:hypothetical protein